MIPNPTIILAVVLAFVLACGGSWWAGDSHGHDAQLKDDNQAWQQQKIDAGTELTKQTQKTADAEKQLAEFKSLQERKDVANSDAIDDLSAQLAARGRLRDPNAKPGNCGGGPKGANPGAASVGAADGADAGGLLSTQLDGLLRRLTREADAINNAYISCRTERQALTTKDGD